MSCGKFDDVDIFVNSRIAELTPGEDLREAGGSLGLVSYLKTFSDQDLSGQLLIEDITGRDPTGLVNTTSEVPGAHGVRLVSTHHRAREIVVKYGIKADTAAQRHASTDLLIELCGSSLTYFYFSDEPERFYFGTFSIEERTNPMPNYTTGEIRIFCPEPYKYGNYHSYTLTGNNIIRQGVHVEPKIIWTLPTSPSSHGSVWIELGGRRLTIDRAISGGQQVEIDSLRKEVRVGGILEVENIHGEFPSYLSTSSSLTRSTGGQLRYEYQSRYL